MDTFAAAHLGLSCTVLAMKINSLHHRSAKQTISLSDGLPDLLWLWLFYGVRPWHRLLMALYFRVEIVGSLTDKRRDPTISPLILAPRHTSRWDPVVMGLLSPHPLRYVATRTEFVGWQGWWMSRLGAIPIDRIGTRSSSIHQMEQLLLAGETLVIFPEGGIHPHQMGELKPGLARLLVRMLRRYQQLIPVIPIVIEYQPRPQWRAKVVITIRDPLYLSPEGDRDAPQTASPVHDKILACRLTQQLASSLRQECALEEPKSSS
ncbi:MAG: lysophospholipid acyltransferase family protein [Cyanobacteriota bacterium]|nr:lysophospholipid acyltransferase family protein [Cyanobacteriota bacterium]